jgi:transcriptional regulator with XRE-family HTH domain
MTIIDKIREVRSLKCISQEYMACQLGIDTSSYHRLERGTSPLSIGRLERIAAVLNVSVVELLNLEKPIELQPSEQSNYINHLENEIKFLRTQLQESIAIAVQSQDSGTKDSAFQVRRR